MTPDQLRNRAKLIDRQYREALRQAGVVTRDADMGGAADEGVGLILAALEEVYRAGKVAALTEPRPVKRANGKGGR